MPFIGPIQSGTTEPASPVVGQPFFNTTTGKYRVYNGTAWVDVNGSSSSGLYTTRGIIFDWDPGRLSLSDGSSIANSTSLSAGINTTYTQSGTAVAVNGGSFVYQSEQGGHIDSTANTGRISVTGTSMASALDACASITLTCWFQSNGAGRQVLISRYGTGFPDQFNHIVDPTGDFHSNSTGAIAGASANHDFNAWSNNTWSLSHFVYSVSDGIARWYINGSAVGTANWGTDGGAGLSVSGSGAGFGIMSRADRLEDLVGRMGPVRIHNVALTTGEISSEWSNERSRFGV